MGEPAKVPITRWPSNLLFKFSVHLVAIFGAVVILSLNFFRVWIGKELQGPISEDGQKLFALQLTAKAHELFMFASLSDIFISVLLKRLTSGLPAPFASLGAGMNFQNGSFIFSREFLALCSAPYRGRLSLVLLLVLSMALGVTVGPSSATAMIPILDDWPAGDISFVLNTTQDQIWPKVLTKTSIPRSPDAAWVSIENNLFSYWGHETLGSVLATPEIAAVPGTSSVRTMEVRFRGPFSLYQPGLSAVTVQSAVIADAVNSIRLFWYSGNANQCAWAKSRIHGGPCTYKDIRWTIQALQPVVFTRCLSSNNSEIIDFPTLARGVEEPKEAAVLVNLPSHASGSTTDLQGVDLGKEDGFVSTSVGVFLRTSAFTGAEASELYACAIDAQWAYADTETTFIGTPYLVSGSPSQFFAPNISSSPYNGWRVNIDRDWVSQINPSLGSNSNETAFDKLLSAGGTANRASKVEAVLAVLVAQAMASLESDATIQSDSPEAKDALVSIEHTAERLNRTPGYHKLTLRTSVSGYAYGISSAKGISISSLLSVTILSCYMLTAVTFLAWDLLSSYHVNSWYTTTDLLALALHSVPSPELRNTSCGVSSVETLQTPVLLATRNRCVEMVFGQTKCTSKAAYQSLERDRKYC